MHSCTVKRPDCAAMMKAQVPGVTIQKAEQMPAHPVGSTPKSGMMPMRLQVAMPAYCRVDGIVDARKGVNGVDYGIGFAIALPENWAGRRFLRLAPPSWHKPEIRGAAPRTTGSA